LQEGLLDQAGQQRRQQRVHTAAVQNKHAASSRIKLGNIFASICYFVGLGRALGADKSPTLGGGLHVIMRIFQVLTRPGKEEEFGEPQNRDP
jgi:hypothetical protein